MDRFLAVIKKLLTLFVKLFTGVCYLVLLFFFVQVFCYTSFRIPSESMDPVLVNGDYILVNKMIKGARLFDVFAAVEGKDVDIYRIPGFGDFKRNDVLVFNFPYPENRWDSISMDVMRYYVKRCIALPGDTLEIRGGRYKVRGCGERLGNQDERYIEKLEHAEQYGIAVDAFPYDEQQGWTVCEFGPLAIPEKGRKVVMNRTNFFLYRQLIDWEQKKKLSLKDGRILLGDSAITQYRFEKDYYFVAGDNMANSQDSRYWGMLPEEYIVGKVVRIWYSEDKYSGKIRWERILKKVR
jgi:signal peptidase I